MKLKISTNVQTYMWISAGYRAAKRIVFATQNNLNRGLVGSKCATLGSPTLTWLLCHVAQ